jgi:flotillin
MVFIPQYQTCKPSQYLAVTGFGIPETFVTKKKWIFPGQQYTFLDVSPENYEFDIQAMSNEKLPFILPAVFTIGPKLTQQDLDLFAKLIGTHAATNKNYLKDVIKGIVEGETRVLAAGLTMESIFEGTKEFKQKVFDKVQLELDQFGLKIYNANIKQLSDLPGHEYFSYLGQKIQKGAANQAKIDIAQADYLGNVGSKEREGETVRQVCKIQNETELFELEQVTITQKKKADTLAEVEIRKNAAAANVSIEKAKLDEATKIAKIEAEKHAEIRESELENRLNIQQASAATEKYRAEKFSKAIVENEIVTKQADASFYQKQKEADAVYYSKQRELEVYFMQKEKEAAVYLMQKEKEAEAVTLLAEAQAAAIGKLMNAFHGDVQSYLYWKMLDDGLYEKLAKANADAIQGLSPNISMWNTSNGGEEGTAKGLRDFFQSIPPIFSTIEQQTGMKMLPTLVSGAAAMDSGKSSAKGKTAAM